MGWGSCAPIPDPRMDTAEQHPAAVGIAGQQLQCRKGFTKVFKRKKKRQGGYMPAFSARVVAYTATLERFI